MLPYKTPIRQRENLPVGSDAGRVPQHQDASTSTSRAWLEHFPPERRSQIANWFHFAVRASCITPEAVIAHVIQELTHRLRYALRHPEQIAHLQAVLVCLTTDRTGALTYAQHVLEYEALPSAARARRKAQQALPYLQAAMQGKSVTLKQVTLLEQLGYDGPVPQDRLQASMAIAALLQQREGSYV